MERSHLLVVGTPTYKGTYTGLLKIFIDQPYQGDLAGTVAGASQRIRAQRIGAQP